MFQHITLRGFRLAWFYEVEVLWQTENNSVEQPDDQNKGQSKQSQKYIIDVPVNTSSMINTVTLELQLAYCNISVGVGNFSGVDIVNTLQKKLC